MCEYVSADHLAGVKNHYLDPNEEYEIGPETITRLNHVEYGFWECWHPETDSWEAMYPPPPGMGLYMTPGSKIRLNTIDQKPEHTKNTPPPEMTPVGTQMRDLI